MSVQTDLFFQTLDNYLALFHKSPPHTFINDDTIPLGTKIDRMAVAVATRTPMV